MYRFKLILMSVLFVLPTLVSADTYRETEEKSFALKAGGEVILENTNGEILVESWDKDEVLIFAEKTVRAGSPDEAREMMQRVRIKIEHSDDFLRVETAYPASDNGFLSFLFGRNTSVSVAYRLTVPHKLDLYLDSVNGKIRINEVSGRIQAHTTNGSIHIMRSGGAVEAKTTNGAIDAELLKFDSDQNMYFKTTNGSIDVAFPPDLRADIEAKTTNGRIKTDFPITVQGEFGKKRLRGEINGGGGRIVLRTTNGGIRITESR